MCGLLFLGCYSPILRTVGWADWEGEKVGTLLQLAVINDQAEMTEWLLDNMNADPTIPVPVVVYRAPQPEDKEILDKRSVFLTAAQFM